MVRIRGPNGWERYVISQWKPRLVLVVSVFVARVCLWGPWPFVTLSLGWPAKGDKQRALQAYIGIKCDPSKTKDAWQRGETGYWMRLDWWECLSGRVHWADTGPVWDNQGEG